MGTNWLLSFSLLHVYLFLSTWCFWSAAEGQRPRNYLSCCCCSCFSLPHLLIYHSLFFLIYFISISLSISSFYTSSLCLYPFCLSLSISFSIIISFEHLPLPYRCQIVIDLSITILFFDWDHIKRMLK